MPHRLTNFADRALVIFDCDGVLVDSEPISCRVHAEALSRHGYPITAASVHARFLGRAARDIEREIESEIGRPLPQAYHRDLAAELLAALGRDVEAIPFVEAALDQITAPCCVASSGSPDKIAVTLSRAGLHARFAPHVFSATEVDNGKPAPDLFLHAAHAMGCDAARCVVVEDSVAGVTAATAAGMTAIGFVGGSHCDATAAAALRAAGAELVLDDMRRLPAAIDRHFASLER